MRNIQLIQQPTGNTCGPTCLKMLYDCITGLKPYPENEVTVEKIAEWCGTDWIVGTPPDRMEKGMKQLNIKYVEYIHSPRPYDLLREVVESGNIGLLRTITKGVPHWIIVDCYYEENQSFGIVDPWLSYLEYSEQQLDSIWKQRDYQFFEIKRHVQG